MINTHRSKIDEIDSKIVDLLNLRVKTCLKIAKVKKDQGIELDDSSRESKILYKLTAESNQTIPDQELIKIYQQIIKSCKKVMSESMKSTLVSDEKL